MNNSFKNLFNKTDTIIAIIIFAMIVFLWNAADNFDSVSDLFAQNIPPQLFPQILLITIGLLTALIPFEHILLKKSGKDIDSGRKKKINFATYGTMTILLTNDDGYDADGICYLKNEIKKIEQTVTFAPRQNCRNENW